MALQDVTDLPLPQLATRAVDSHKGDYGRVLIVGGSRGMAGAPALAGIAALRSGAGRVTVAVPRSIQSTVASFEPSYMTLGLGAPEDDALLLEHRDAIVDAARSANVVALGPGLGRNPSTARLVHGLYHRFPQPLVLDADGLNALAENPDLLAAPAGPRILTPHVGEFRRLAGEDPSVDLPQRAQQAAHLCLRDKTKQTIVILKGHQTLITDGRQYAINHTGNPGMATGGTGDCLTGMIAALVAQGLSPWDAARLGVHLHGLAGDLAAAELGQTALIASDLPRFLSKPRSKDLQERQG